MKGRWQFHEDSNDRFSESVILAEDLMAVRELSERLHGARG